MRRKSVPDLSGRSRAQSDSIGCRQRPPASVGWAAIENPNLSGERPPPARIYLAHNLSHRIYWAQTALAPESVGRAWRCHPLLWGSRVKRHGATGFVGCQPLRRPNLTGASSNSLKSGAPDATPIMLPKRRKSPSPSPSCHEPQWMRATQLTAADCVGSVYDTFLAMLRALNIFVLALCSFLYLKTKKGLYAPPGTRHAPHKKKCRKCGKMVDEHDARTCKKGIGEALASLHHHHRHIVTHPLQPYRFGV